MKITGIPFYPANNSNFTVGRGGNPIKFITVHHSAGWENTLRYLWADPNRNGSSHFWVGNKAGQIEQYVDTKDTAWTNGNWLSNQQSITIEVRGDWRGYYDQQTLDNLESLLQKLRKAYPTVAISYHKDVSDRMTLCPADLKDKGYAKKVWDKVTTWLNPPKPALVITYSPITPKRIKLIRTANLWDFNFSDWTKAKAVKTYNKGEVIDVVAIATNPLGAKYYMTAYSYNNGAVRATNGFNVADCEDYAPQITEPPVIGLRWEKMDKERVLVTDIETRIYDLNTMQIVGSAIPAGTEIEFVEKTTTKDNIMYLRSKWSRDNAKDWGVRMDNLIELEDVPREPVPEPPLDVDPTEPSNGDVVEYPNWFVKLIKEFIEWLQAKIPLISDKE